MLGKKSLSSLSITNKQWLIMMLVFATASYIVIVSGLNERAQEIETASNSAMMLIQSLAAQQDQIAIVTRYQLSTLALLPEVRKLDSDSCNELFRELNIHNPFYTNINAVTPDGNMFAASTPFDKINLADRKHIKDAAKTLDFSAGEYIVGRLTKVKSFNYTFPVLGSDKVPIAFVTAGFNLDAYAEFIKKVKLPEGFSFAILDHAGVRIYRTPEHPLTLPGIPVPKEAFVKMSGDSDHGTFDAVAEDGINRIYAFRQLRLREDATPYMYMIIGVPKDRIIQKANFAILLNLSILGIAAFISILLTWVFGKPISRLSSAALRFGKGDLAVRTSLPHTSDDVGQLAKSFDDMATMLEMRSIESRNAEKALRESESKYRNVVETTGTGYVIVDSEGRVLDANPEYARLSGHSTVQEILGRSVLEWTAPYDLERNAAAVKKCAAEGLIRNLDIDYVDSQGHITPVEVNATLTPTAVNPAIICLIKDITERRRAEAELQDAYEGLEAKIAERTAELSTANDQLRAEIETRKQVEGALRESERRFRSLFESNRAYMLLIDPVTGAILDANEAATEFWGYSNAELRQMNIAQIHQLSKAEIVKALRSIVDRETKGLSFCARLRSGEIRTVEVYSSPVEMGGRTVMFSIVHDITERKRAEDELAQINESLQASHEQLQQEIAFRLEAEVALKESRQELANIIDFLPDATFVINTEGKIIAWNKAIEEVTGVKASDMLGKGDHEYALAFYGERRPMLIDIVLKPQAEWEAKYLNVERRGAALECQLYVPWLIKDGVIPFFFGTASVLRGSDGSILGAIESVRDFSETKRAQEELKQTNVEMAQLVASIPSFLIGLTPQHGITRWNSAAENIFGISSDSVRGKAVDACGIQWDVQKISNAISSCQKNETSIRLDDIRFLRPDGINGFLCVTINSIEGANNGPPGVILLGNDVTHRKILESQLVQAQKLESIGQLAAGIAHEINTPAQYVGDNTRFLQEAYSDLEGIHNLYDQLLKELKSGNPTEDLVRKIETAVEEVDLDYIRQEAPKAVQQSLDGIDRISRIVRAMKDFSHPGTDVKTNIDLNKAIESTITVAKNEWKYVAEMVTDFDPGLPLVPCLPAEINQVILNMIINASHAVADALKQDGSSEKGTITIGTRTEGDHAQIRVTDTGTGIPENIRSKIFDPFFTTKEVGKGTGQGLAISHSIIVDKHGGTITFESEVGKGTSFIINLPLNQDGSEK